MELEDESSVAPQDYAGIQKKVLKLQQENEIFKKSTPIFVKIN